VVTFFVSSFIEGQNKNNKKVIPKNCIFFIYSYLLFFVDSFFKSKIEIMKKSSQKFVSFLYILNSNRYILGQPRKLIINMGKCLVLFQKKNSIYFLACMVKFGEKSTSSWRELSTFIKVNSIHL
jgi:hypothetical protein